MSLWMSVWVVYTVAVSVLALMLYANDRDERKVSEYYRRKWLGAVNPNEVDA